jgi:four helix bundle protein
MSSLEKLAVYGIARETCARAYRLGTTIVGDAALRDQIRRAATSVVLNIAEGRGRHSDADFARFLAMARGSNTELTAQIDFAMDLGLIDADEAGAVAAGLDRIGRI